MELWDAYDANCRPLGRDLVRGEPIPAGCFHAVAEVFVRHREGRVLLTRRDLNKPSYPGFWELGCGGSVQKGEAWLQGALRELREETGIRADALTPAYVIIRPENGCIYAGFVCDYDGPEDAVTLQAGETVDYRWVTLPQLFAFLNTSDCIPAQRRRWRVLLHRLGWQGKE